MRLVALQDSHKKYQFTLKFIPFFIFFLFKNLFFLHFLNCCSSTVASISPHHHSPPSQPSPPPTLHPTPLWCCPCVLYTCSWKALPHFPLLSPPTYPLVTIIFFFLISLSLVIFCLLVCFVNWVPVKGEIIRYLSLTVAYFT